MQSTDLWAFGTVFPIEYVLFWSILLCLHLFFLDFISARLIAEEFNTGNTTLGFILRCFSRRWTTYCWWLNFRLPFWYLESKQMLWKELFVLINLYLYFAFYWLSFIFTDKFFLWGTDLTSVLSFLCRYFFILLHLWLI